MKYKVIETMHGQFVAKDVENVIFVGNLTELNRDYPLSRVYGADKLSHKEIEDGFVRWDYTFFKSSDDLNWITCSDPRSYTDRELTEWERAIDEENRRLYPGDFSDEYDDMYEDDDDLYF